MFITLIIFFSVHLCNIQGDLERHEVLPLRPDLRRFCIFSLTFSQDGTEVLGGANDGCLYIYDCERHERTLRIDAHSDDINTVAYADETSQILFSGADDGLCKVWDRRTLSENGEAKPVGILAGHVDGLTFIDSRGDGRHLITNSKDQSIKL
jgi:WD repeat-containing protein 23